MINNKESQENSGLNKERFLDYINKFSFPRLAGTEGEEKAVNLTIKTFREKDFNENEIFTQNFEFSTFYSITMMKIIILMNLIFIATIFLIKYLYPFLTFFSILILLLIFLSMLKVLRHPELRGFWEKHFGNFIKATNVFVKIPATNDLSQKVGDIIVSAHLDSKSQSFKTIWRVIIIRIWLYSEIFLFLFYIFFLVDYHFYEQINRIVEILWEIFIITGTILTVVSNAFLLFLNIENDSPGALDNATGMSIVFELSSLFKKSPLHNFNLWFCQFSGEEIGTMGSRQFLDMFDKKFTKKYTYQINFDMVSITNNKRNFIEYIKSYGIVPRKKISPILSQYFINSAEIKRVNYHGFHVSLGAHTDSIPFHLRKFDSIDITTRAAAKYTHSAEDTPDKVDPQILLDAYKVIRLLIQSLDKDYNKLIK
ncbi:MAG: M28 family metallopeptidase [Promethearchaeota archaeon]